jgi:hypothetical protein
MQHRIKDKNHMIISINTKNSFDKIQNPLMKNFQNKLYIKGSCINIIKTVFKKPVANIILNEGKCKALLLISGRKFQEGNTDSYSM